MSSPITIVEYNPQWPLMYEGEKSRILGAIGHKIVAIEHIGSTAVPGLGAKPIIDIMVAVHRLADAEECVGPLQTIDYEYVPYPDFPERRFFRDGPMGVASHHLHMVEFTSDFWERNLLFRDFLRNHSTVAQEYSLLKMEWAAKYGSDREKYEAYTEAKTPFIESVIARARAAKATNR